MRGIRCGSSGRAMTRCWRFSGCFGSRRCGTVEIRIGFLGGVRCAFGTSTRTTPTAGRTATFSHANGCRTTRVVADARTAFQRCVACARRFQPSRSSGTGGRRALRGGGASEGAGVRWAQATPRRGANSMGEPGRRRNPTAANGRRDTRSVRSVLAGRHALAHDLDQPAREPDRAFHGLTVVRRELLHLK